MELNSITLVFHYAWVELKYNYNLYNKSLSYFYIYFFNIF